MHHSSTTANFGNIAPPQIVFLSHITLFLTGFFHNRIPSNIAVICQFFLCIIAIRTLLAAFPKTIAIIICARGDCSACLPCPFPGSYLFSAFFSACYPAAVFCSPAVFYADCLSPFYCALFCCCSYRSCYLLSKNSILAVTVSMVKAVNASKHHKNQHYQSSILFHLLRYSCPFHI